MKVTAIGGGTGTSAVLQGLRGYEDLELGAIVSMMDDGGSNAVVRDEFGLLPLSDLRKAIISLSSHAKDEIFRDIFTYRFSKGNGLKGHTLGNLIMVGLSEITGSEIDAIKGVQKIFDIRGEILPVTLDNVRLVAEYDDGTTVTGEHLIDEPEEDKKVLKLSLNSNAKAYEGAVDAIMKSRFVVIGPGDLYTSIIANIVVPGISEALQETKAELIFVTNLMSKKGETKGMTATDMVDTIEEYVGRKMDYVVVNNKMPEKNLLERYKEDGESQIQDDLKKKSGKTVVRTDLLSREKVKLAKGDTLKRSLIRHDPNKLGRELYGIFRRGVFDVFSRFISDLS